MRHRVALTTCIVSLAALLAAPAIAQERKVTATPVATAIQLPAVNNASLVAGHYTLVLTATKNGQSKSSTFSVQVASSGAGVTEVDAPVERRTASMATSAGAFSGNEPLHAARHLGQDAHAHGYGGDRGAGERIDRLVRHVEDRSRASVSGTFTLNASPVPPQAHAKQIKNYGDSPDTSSGDGEGGVIDAIGKWLDACSTGSPVARRGDARVTSTT